MAIGTPVSIGTVIANSITGAAVALTTTANIVSGDLVVVVIGNSGASASTVSSASDGTNTYVKGKSQINGSGNADGELWYKENAAAVGSGATLTVSFTGSASNGVAIAAARISGIVTASSLDKSAIGPGTGTTTPSASTGALTQATEIVIGVVVSLDGVPTESANFTTISSISSPNTNANLDYGYDIVASTGSVTYQPTVSAAHGTGLIIASFEGIVAASGFVPYTPVRQLGPIQAQ